MDKDPIADRDPAAVAREIIDMNQYMVLATAGDGGEPWISPVWFAHDRYRAFYWLSRPERQHSRNVAARPRLAISIFDAGQRIGVGFGVMMLAEASALEPEGLAGPTEIVNAKSVASGGGMFSIEYFEAGDDLRLYRAVTTRTFVILGDDERRPVEL